MPRELKLSSVSASQEDVDLFVKRLDKMILDGIETPSPIGINSHTAIIHPNYVDGVRILDKGCTQGVYSNTAKSTLNPDTIPQYHSKLAGFGHARLNHEFRGITFRAGSTVMWLDAIHHKKQEINYGRATKRYLRSWNSALEDCLAVV